MSAPAPPPPVQAKPALSEEELDKKSKSIIEEYLHINDMKVCTSIYIIDLENILKITCKFTLASSTYVILVTLL